MWFALLWSWTPAEACLNEMEAARTRQLAAQEELRGQQREAVDGLDRRLRRDLAAAVRAAEEGRARARVEARSALAEQEAARRARVGRLGAAVGLLGALGCAVLTGSLAVRVERAGGPREVRYS